MKHTRECECAHTYPLFPLSLRVSSRLWMPLYWILVTNPPGLAKYTCTMPLSITTCYNFRILICHAMPYSIIKVRKLMSHLIVLHVQFHCWWGHGDDFRQLQYLIVQCSFGAGYLSDKQVSFGQVLLQPEGKHFFYLFVCSVSWLYMLLLKVTVYV